MEDQTKELIAIGASIAAHCQSCLVYHIGKARELGIDDEAIRSAVEVGNMVQKGAMSEMKKFEDAALNAGSSQSGKCCQGNDPKCCS